MSTAVNANGSAFGRTLKALRRERRLSQADFAGRIGSTQRHLSFLETGRANPSQYMIQRIERELTLSVGRAQVLYETAGFSSPYKCRAEDSPDVLDALDLIDSHILANWPFPAFVLDKRWTILRHNQPAGLLLAQFAGHQNEPLNMFRIFVSPEFRAKVLNWDQAAPIFAARLLKEAADDPELAELLEEARKGGFFDGLDETFRENVPVFVPVEISGPNGSVLRLTSLLGQLASVQDAVIEGMTIELMVPLDVPTQSCLLAAGALAAAVPTEKRSAHAPEVEGLHVA